MSFTPRSQHVTSLYLQTERPTIPRQRSNSVPAGLPMLNAVEAGILISAAEKATARRRRPISVDSPIWPVDSPMENMNWPLPSTSTIKPSPLRQSTARKLEIKKVAQVDFKLNAKSRALRNLDTNQIVNGRNSPALPYADSLLKRLPVDLVSSTRRQVTNHSLKSYADGLFQFTQIRFVTSVPQVKHHLISPATSVYEDDEPASPHNNATLKPRPSLDSHFSDWSMSSRDPASRPISLNADTPPVFDMDAAMMSPDSFFGGDEQVTRKDIERLRRTPGYASSETYDLNVDFQFEPSPKVEKSNPAEEFSYFANYDEFVNRVPAFEESLPPLEPPESLTIEISPVEQSLSPPTPPPPKRARAGTVVRQPMIRSCSSGVTPRCAHSSPATPYNIAQARIRMPNWCGAMG